MKLLCFLVGISACGFAHAQQSPALPPGPTREALPGVSIMRPQYAPPGSTSPSGNATAPDSLRAQQELTDLIRAQSEAIRILSGKVDSLDDRLRRIESRLR